MWPKPPAVAGRPGAGPAPNRQRRRSSRWPGSASVCTKAGCDDPPPRSSERTEAEAGRRRVAPPKAGARVTEGAGRERPQREPNPAGVRKRRLESSAGGCRRGLQGSGRAACAGRGRQANAARARGKAASYQGGLQPDPSERRALESPRRGRRKRGVRAMAATAGAGAGSEPESIKAVASAQLIRSLSVEASGGLDGGGGGGASRTEVTGRPCGVQAGASWWW